MIQMTVINMVKNVFLTRFTINAFNAKSIHVSTLFFFFFSLFLSFFLLLLDRFLCKIKVTKIVSDLVGRESRESDSDSKPSFACT